MECSNTHILKEMPLGDGIVRLCTSKDSVSSLLAADPSLAPGDAWKKLYDNYTPSCNDQKRSSVSEDEDLTRAAQCGKWGPTKPSTLFLKVTPVSPYRNSFYVLA